MCEPGLHKDSRLGKVSIREDELKMDTYCKDEQWFPLQQITPDTEVQVDIHVGSHTMTSYTTMLGQDTPLS